MEQPETARLHSLISVPKDAPKRLLELFNVVGTGVATERERAEWWKLLTELVEKQMPQLSEENRRLAEEQLRLLEPLAKGK